MTEVIEAVAISNVQDDKVKCPFCPNKKLDECKPKKQDPDMKVVSKPSQLACTPLIPKGEYLYTTAKHHLISAKQCYAKLDRVVRMGSMAKYDINAPKNGIPLPTINNDLRYTVGDKVNAKYGDLSLNEKKTVAFSVMEVEKAQWHVGHHAVQIKIADNWANEEEDTPWRRGHLISYDNEVLNKLLKLVAKFEPESQCDEAKPDNFKTEMDSLSDKIKEKLNKFKTSSPSSSKPFFVSQLAASYAKSKDKTPPKIVKPSRGKKK